MEALVHSITKRHANLFQKNDMDFGKDPIPTLESKDLSDSDRSMETSKSSELSMIKQIRNLQRFTNEVCENKLFWTPEVLDFFQVAATLRGGFEAEREKYQ